MKELEFYNIDTSSLVDIPLVGESVPAGFPSPADDYIEDSIDLNKLLVNHPSTTFIVRAGGESMKDRGIDPGDLMIVDRSLKPYENCIGIFYIDGEFTVKSYQKHEDHILLMPANEKYQPIKVTKDNQFIFWGIVKYIIKKA